MDTKLLSKEVIKGFIMREFNNDPRITDELLFKGSRMTLECYVLLKDLMPSRGYYEGNILDDLGYHCYLIFSVPSESTKNYDDRVAKLIKPKLEKIYERLDKLVGDTGCYMVSDVISGERDSNDYTGNRNHSYGSGDDKIIIDIWVFSREASMLEFGENNETKTKLLLETDMQ